MIALQKENFGSYRTVEVMGAVSQSMQNKSPEFILELCGEKHDEYVSILLNAILKINEEPSHYPVTFMKLLLELVALQHPTDRTKLHQSLYTCVNHCPVLSTSTENGKFGELFVRFLQSD